MSTHIILVIIIVVSSSVVDMLLVDMLPLGSGSIEGAPNM